MNAEKKLVESKTVPPSLTGIRLTPSTASYASCMELTALALGYPASRPLRSSPNMFVLSLTGLGCWSSETVPGKK